MDSFATVERDFMEARAKLIELAAYLDRVDRHGDGEDFRHRALLACLPILTSPPAAGQRARAVLASLSDTSDQPLAAATAKPACGAPPPSKA
jgi:hypothetical protein